ncbi:hypothetical protein B0I72DRAFT_31392 [Yarrowia lipolytica]|jgi:hypothetical protein|uniref:YALI0F09647p n=2 Tax=Yarrowia lipolytica TaxID=4952 RepID=Q6C295_YARLI|nr:YALI0F09647p [Yarrowia lipolytica CLIB122]AOW06918.1 hypothetical protein YALI1_F13211g [Yarrowia lipolytica]KAB8284029.1 hypothetical protein BKA91DRAFT_8155 [Yarrowia lipolytica]KAE8173616.1 hypothetical protein BKA90DRAFT_5873 [Yarrowia lipolytica]KAJ8055902.1 hypothetical protein LXG23DRAFT_17085 [Yarrowia lipolytica]QNQ01242.1 Hypothetical protein YALI2_F00787g [Yarrowia lipolytica]|eukprot:XP_505217.2 YALI0F09647p [Yarrowia lipolytica CLIB122]
MQPRFIIGGKKYGESQRAPNVLPFRRPYSQTLPSSQPSFNIDASQNTKKRRIVTGGLQEFAETLVGELQDTLAYIPDTYNAVFVRWINDNLYEAVVQDKNVFVITTTGQPSLKVKPFPVAGGGFYVTG